MKRRRHRKEQNVDWLLADDEAPCRCAERVSVTCFCKKLIFKTKKDLANGELANFIFRFQFSALHPRGRLTCKIDPRDWGRLSRENWQELDD